MMAGRRASHRASFRFEPRIDGGTRRASDDRSRTLTLRRAVGSSRPVLAVVAAIALFLATAGVAAAYFTSSGNGAGTATTGALGPPTAVTASSSAGTGVVAVTWTAPSGPPNATGYYVLRVPTSGPSQPACGTSSASPTSSTSCNDSGVPLGTYTYVVVAKYQSWTATSTASTPVTVGQATQSITFTSNPVAPTFGGSYTVSATGGGSGNPVTFSSATTGVCTVAGSTVTFVHAGTCTINADQAGSTYYSAAPQVQQTFTVAKASQPISFTTTAPAAAVVGGPGYTPAATGGGSGNTVIFTIDATTTGVCSISSGVVTYQHVGTCTVDADQAGNGDYLAANQVQQSYAVGQGSQAITFTSTAPSNAKVNGSTYTVSATGGDSGNTVNFSSATPGVCTVLGSTVSFVGAGTCTINANQSGNVDYLPASQVQQSFAVTKNDQTISFTSTAPGSATFGGTDTATATASSGLTVTFSTDTASVCTVSSGGSVSFVGVGTCHVNANQAGDAAYNAAPQVQQSFTVSKANQTVTFTSTAPSNATVGGATYSVAATATSGLAVAFTSATTSVCTVAGSTVSFVGFGTCTINADQGGNSNYNAALQVQQSFAVKANQTITFTQPATPATATTTASLSATATSGLTVTFTSATTSVCTVSGTTVSYLASGTCTIDADQAGNATYNAASQVARNVTVNKANQTITFTQPTTPASAGTNDTLVATSTSGLPVTFTSPSAATICTVSGTTVTYVGAGSCVINANQAGNGTYNAATQVQRTVAVSAAFAIVNRTSGNPQNTTVVSGTGTAGATVTVYMCDGTQASCGSGSPNLTSNPNFSNPQTTTVGAGGTWTVTFSKLLNGSGTFTTQAFQTSPAATSSVVVFSVS